MRIRNTGPAISGAPAPGEIGEVDDQLGEAMVRRGFAQRIETLSDRLGIGQGPNEWTLWDDDDIEDEPPGS